MNTKSGIVRSTGILCLVLTAIVIAWYLLESWVSTDVQEAAADLQRIAASPGTYLAFIDVDVLYNLAFIAVGGLFYIMFRRRSESLAFFGFLGFLVTGLVWLVSDFPMPALYNEALEWAKASGAARAEEVSSAAHIALAWDYPSVIVSTAYGIALILFGMLIWRTQAVHRLLGLLAIVVGIAQLVDWIGAVTLMAVGRDVLRGSVYWNVVWYASDAWFLLTGLWLLVKGVKEAPAAAPGR